MKRSSATILLILAAVFWGTAFIAQKSAMDFMGPLTFVGSRFLVAGLVVLPFAIREYKKNTIVLTRQQKLLTFTLCINFFLGSWLQQWGLLTTTATNAGFLSGLYVFFVPVIQLTLFRTKPHLIVWICAPIAIFGMFLLSGASVDPFGIGEYLVITSAVFWAMQLYLLGHLVVQTKLPLTITSACFLVTGLLGTIGAFSFETVSLAVLQIGWVEILYTAVFSTAISFSLQAMGQQHVPPANAAIILSSEGLFAAAGGALILGERLSATGYVGIAILFTAIVAVEAIPHWRNNKKSRVL